VSVAAPACGSARRTVHRSSPNRLASQSERPRPAELILNELERHSIPDRQVLERGTFMHVAAMKVDLAIIAQPNVSVTLTTGDLGNATGRETASLVKIFRLVLKTGPSVP
jgi:hypothetical protein